MYIGLTVLSRGNITPFSLTTFLFTSFSIIFCQHCNRYSWRIPAIFKSFSESQLSKFVYLFLLNIFLLIWTLYLNVIPYFEITKWSRLFFLTQLFLLIFIITMFITIYDSSVFFYWLTLLITMKCPMFHNFFWKKTSKNNDFPPLATVPELSLDHFLIYFSCISPEFYWNISYSSFKNIWHKLKSEAENLYMPFVYTHKKQQFSLSSVSYYCCCYCCCCWFCSTQNK